MSSALDFRLHYLFFIFFVFFLSNFILPDEILLCHKEIKSCNV